MNFKNVDPRAQVIIAFGILIALSLIGYAFIRHGGIFFKSKEHPKIEIKIPPPIAKAKK